MRFDEVELAATPVIEELPPAAAAHTFHEAPRFRRMLAFLSDVSLFVALSLAMSPLLPVNRNAGAALALVAFLVMTSYYYFVGAWLLWGKTVGGAIFDVKVAAPDSSMSLKAASLRFCGLYASLLTCGIGFLLALLPGRRSLADRLSRTRCIAAF